MKQLTEAELAKRQAEKVARTIINLKYRLMADREINEGVPALSETIDSFQALGKTWTLDLPSVTVKAVEQGE